MIPNNEIREILIKRVDQQKQAVGMVAGIIEPNGRRVVAYGNLAERDPRPLDGDTIFEIGSVSKVSTCLLLADMVKRKGVNLDDPAAKYLPEYVRLPERNGKSITGARVRRRRCRGHPCGPDRREPYVNEMGEHPSRLRHS